MRWSLLVLVAACRAAESPGPSGARPVDTGEVAVVPWPACPDEDTTLSVDVEVGAHSNLTLRVTWSTDQPATSEVVFGEDTPLWRLSDDEEVTEHEVVLYGLHAETDVTLQARSISAEGTTACSGQVVGHTGPLPPSVPVAELGVFVEGEMQPGWTLVNVSNRFHEWPPTAVMYDLAGRPVWYVISEPDAFDDRGDLDVSLTSDLHILVGGSGPDIRPRAFDLTGREVWTGPPQVAPIQHHHFQRASDGTYMMLRHGANSAFPGLNLSTVVQIDASHAPVWTWDPYEHMDALGVEPTAQGDAMHANSVTLDGDHIFLNSRELSRLYKVARSTGEIEWALGRLGDFAADPDAATPWFKSQHEPERQADGSWLFYDNNGLPGDHSRVVQLAVDEQSFTTEVLWEFPGAFRVDPWYSHAWFSPIWGDADRLPNGHVLVTAGTRAAGTQSRVFEVTPEGHVVWELLLPASDGEDVVGIYRAERFDPPGLESMRTTR